MFHSASDLPGGTNRRSAERLVCNTGIVCQVTDPLDQFQMPGGMWDVSTGGARVVVEPHYLPGARLAIELRNVGEGTSLLVWAEVKHSLLCPSFREMWLIGCSFVEEVPAKDLQPFVSGGHTDSVRREPAG
jgi:hypothetical protein